MLICVDGRVLEEGARGGVSEYARSLLCALLLADKENRYVIFTNKLGGGIDFLEKFVRPNVIFSSFPYPNKFLNFSLAISGRPRLDDMVEADIYKKTGKREKIDIFWAPNINFIRLRDDTKLALTVHDVSFLVESGFFNLKQRIWHALVSPKRLIQRANLLLPVSSYTAGELLRLGLGAGSVEIAGPGIARDFFETTENEVAAARTQYSLPQRYVLTLAAKGKRKNIEGAIKAFLSAKLPPDLNFVIAGEGTDSLKKGRRITGLGAVSDAARRALYHGAEFFIYPSFYEGFGLPVLEAAASGTPVITSSSTSLSGILGSACLMADPHDASELAAAMEILSNNPGLARGLAARARLLVQEYSWEGSAEKVLSAFRNLN